MAGDLSLLKSLPEQTGGDVIDAALDAAQEEISSQLAEVESRELAQIEGALERMREGTYGECDICQGKIPLARLNAHFVFITRPSSWNIFPPFTRSGATDSGVPSIFMYASAALYIAWFLAEVRRWSL